MTQDREGDATLQREGEVLQVRGLNVEEQGIPGVEEVRVGQRGHENSIGGREEKREELSLKKRQPLSEEVGLVRKERRTRI